VRVKQRRRRKIRGCKQEARHDGEKSKVRPRQNVKIM
jgi:hypothetical protein